MRGAGIDPEVPPNPLPYLVDWLFEIGPTLPAGMGAGPIEWRDLAAWQATTGVDLLAWEARLLRQLSLAWLNEAQGARKPDCPAPWTAPRTSDEARAAVARKVSNTFAALVAAQGNRKARKS